MNELPKEPSEDYRAKIISYKWDFLKFFLGTVVLGIATVGTTYIFKDYELKIESRKSETTYLKPYFDSFKEIAQYSRYEEGVDMADFLIVTAIDSDLKRSWTDLRNYLQGKLDTLRKRDQLNDSTFDKISKEIGNKHLAIEALKQKTKVDKAYTKAKFNNDSAKIVKQIEDAENKLMSVNDQKIEIVADLKKALSDPQKAQSPPSKSNYEIVYDQNRWAGKGYFNKITPEITVSINNYNNKNNVSLSITVLGVTRSYNKSIGELINDSFQDGEYNISITLLALKNMGSGPFSSFNKEVSYHIKVERQIPEKR